MREKHEFTAACLVALLVLTSFYARTAAAQESEPRWFLVLDLTSYGLDRGDPGNRIHSFNGLEEPGTRLVESLRRMDSADTRQPGVVLEQIRKERQHSTSRWVSRKGDEILIYVFYDSSHPPPSITIEEQERSSRFGKDLATLFKVVGRIMPVVPVEPKYERVAYTLTKERANLVVAASDPSASNEEERSVQAKLVTGPKEHWYLSTDVRLNSLSELKFNSDTNSIELRDKPARFLVGFGYLLGDLTATKRPLWSGISLKLLVEASRDPLDSLGFAVGYRLPAVGRYGFALEAFSPFIGVMRIEEDKMLPGGGARIDGDSSYEVVVGLSLNLDEALGWVDK